jgi:hypothetical protein
VGKKNVPTTPLPFVVATSWVIVNDINKSAGQECGSSGGGRGDSRKGVKDINQ